MNEETQELNSPSRPEDRPAVIVQTILLGTVVMLVLVAAFLWLRTPATPLASAEDLDALTREGKPVLAEFYSNT